VLNVNPERRLDIEGIKNHEWFNIINPKPNLSEGLLIEKIVIPVDEDILKEMKKFGYKINDVRINVLYNKHNHITTTYYLMLRQKVRSCIPSIADLKSRLFKEYINNENNLLEKYGNSIENYISTIKKDEIENDKDNNDTKTNNNAQCVKKDKDDNKSNKHNTMSKQIENPPLSYREKPSITMSLPIESNNVFKTYERNEETTTINTLITTTTNNNNIKRNTSNNKYAGNQKMKKHCKTIYPSSHKNHPKYQIITNNNTISTSYHKHNSTRAFHPSKHSKQPSSTLPTEPNSNHLLKTKSIPSKGSNLNNSMKIICYRASFC
jgi:5'-AMP-activated protein kinase catalytic alpha subunit